MVSTLCLSLRRWRSGEMAEVFFSGLDDLMLTMEQLSQIPDDVQDAMLNAQADVVVQAQKDKARAYNVQDTGEMIRSIKKGRVKQKRGGGKVIYVTPSGTRMRGNKKVRNAEIAFVNEYGTRDQQARPFIRDANETSAKATTEAGAEIFFKWQEKQGL